MAYAFEAGESVRAAIVRITEEVIDRARAQLADRELSNEKRVHEARKRFKEIRAVLGLVREPLAEFYRLENAFFRDAGRALAEVRDADAIVEALQKLDIADDIRKRAQAALEAQQKRPDLDRLIARTARALDLARTRVAHWPEMADSFETLASGLVDAYRGGRRTMREAESDAEIHEWRKLAKRHWYHVQMLRNVAPETFHPYSAIMHDLSQHLGDHHDLHVLRERLPDADHELLDAVAGKQKDLEAEAREVGANVYADKPKVWLERVREQWNAWRR
jgi:CHAD domain-containing protein